MRSSRIARFLSWIIAVILVLVPFQALLTTWAGSNFGHLDLFRIWKEVLLVVMAPPAFWLAWHSNQKRWFIRSPLLNLIRLYFLLQLALGIWAYSRHEVNRVALIYAWIINVRFLLFFVVCAIVAANYDFLRRNWSKILLLPAGLVILFGLLQKVLPYDFLRHFGYGPKTIPAYQTVDSSLDFRRIQSTLRGANPLGAYLVVALTAAASSLRKNRMYQWGIWLGGLLVIFYSYSRSAWIGLVLSLGFLATLSVGKSKRVRLVAVAGAGALIVIGGGAYLLRYNHAAQDTLFHTSQSSAAPESSNAQRVAAIKQGFKDVIHQPLGRGPGTAGPASFRNDHPDRIAEDYYLQIGQEVGIIGVVLFVAINIMIGRELFKRLDEILPRILLASLIGLTFINLISHAWTDDTLAYVWWGLAGIALAPAILTGRHKQNGKAHQA